MQPDERSLAILKRLSAAIAFGLWFPIAFHVLRKAVLGVRAEQRREPVEVGPGVART
jgi:hypothetical protein